MTVRPSRRSVLGLPSMAIEDEGPLRDDPPPRGVNPPGRSSPVPVIPARAGPGLVAAATGLSSESGGSSGSLTRWEKSGAVLLTSYHTVLAEVATVDAGLVSDSSPELTGPSPSGVLDRLSDPALGE